MQREGSTLRIGEERYEVCLRIGPPAPDAIGRIWPIVFDG